MNPIKHMEGEDQFPQFFGCAFGLLNRLRVNAYGASRGDGVGVALGWEGSSFVEPGLMLLTGIFFEPVFNKKNCAPYHATISGFKLILSQF